MFSGMLLFTPSPLKRSCKNRVNKILEDAIVKVSDAPILSGPTTYSNAAARGNREKDIKYIHSWIDQLQKNRY
jgi:hypothetical protein